MEAMTIIDYCFYAAMGLTVVFCALIFLMLVIWIMGKFEFGGKKEEAPAKVAAPAAVATAPAGPVAPGTAGELKLYDTDPRDAAMIMAIVADELGKPLNELRFTSIREVRK
jgi:Na+-transporting methylmalonyl-CoA/oxaloacetate decarboxylase gamma subunit